ncbi:unnamed protein product, partial [Prorocentrum cordatum]
VAIGSFKCEKGEWGSWANAEVFLRGWRAVNDDGRYRHHDWTIKVDADTVFYPDRFPMHMDKLQLTGDRSVFFMNFMPGYPVVGALEAVSTIVLIAFFDQHFNECDDLAIGAAEDCWFWKCMERMGAEMIQVGFYTTSSIHLLLRHHRSRGCIITALWDDSLLQHEGHPEGDKCTDGWFVAMHPFKTVGEYNACIDRQGFGT